MLLGILKRNGIMIIDFAIMRRREDEKSPEEAIYEASMVRFRPIVMTTLAGLMRTVPIGAGWEPHGLSRMPLGLCVVGELMF
jgi:HAE1 family hydrophobic/amphiphilic exporter-1